MPTHNGAAVVSAASMMPHKPGRAPAGVEHNGFHSSSAAYSSSSASSVITFSASNRQPAPPGAVLSVHPHGQGYSLGSNCGLAPPPPPKDPAGLQVLQHHSCDGYPLPGTVCKAVTSISHTHEHKRMHTRTGRYTHTHTGGLYHCETQSVRGCARTPGQDGWI